MIQVQTNLKITDNSGVKAVKCIKVYKHKYAITGSIVLVSVTQFQKKKMRLRSTISKGNKIASKVIFLRLAFACKMYIFGRLIGPIKIGIDDRIYTKGTEDHDASATKSLCPQNYPTC